MRALITGANGDIGCALLNYLLLEGFDVTAIDKNTNQLQAKANNKVEILQADFSCNLNVEGILKQLNKPFDVFIYAAGIREIVSAVELNINEWLNVINVNLTAAFLLSQHAVKLAMAAQKPLSIVYISSISGLYGEPERSAYCASKHGLIGLAKALAIELAPHSIRVNVVAPGIIETDLTRPYQANPQTMALLNQNIPLGRWGQPKHIVQTVDLILKNDYLTGSTLVVDGGWTAGKRL